MSPDQISGSCPSDVLVCSDSCQAVLLHATCELTRNDSAGWGACGHVAGWAARTRDLHRSPGAGSLSQQRLATGSCRLDHGRDSLQQCFLHQVQACSWLLHPGQHLLIPISSHTAESCRTTVIVTLTPGMLTYVKSVPAEATRSACLACTPASLDCSLGSK